MRRYEIIGLLALLAIVIALPVYATRESFRMHEAQGELRQRYVVDSTDMYLDNCVGCHGVAGAGVGAMPPLNTLGPAGADPDLLYNTIAYSPHGTAMSAWHVADGGKMSEYQVEGLVTFILHADWGQVRAEAAAREVVVLEPAAVELDMGVMDIGAEEDPHECRSCHEEPEVHAERFGLNCSRCHTLAYWKPALLLRHTFLLDHGGEGGVACQTCHTASYAAHTCYECHDHDPEGMRQAHLAEGIDEFDACADCHPTGVEGEAARLGYGLSGGGNVEERSGDAESGQPGLGEAGQPGLGKPFQQGEDGQWELGEPQGGSDAGPGGTDEREPGAGGQPDGPAEGQESERGGVGR